jgi:hypothetical protein
VACPHVFRIKLEQHNHSEYLIQSDIRPDLSLPVSASATSPNEV